MPCNGLLERDSGGTSGPGLLPLILADVFEHFPGIIPLRWRSVGNAPSNSPWRRVGSRVIDRRFVVQRLEVGSGDALGEMQLYRRRIGPGDPRFLVEANRVDHQSVALPFARRVSKKCGTQCIAGRVRTSIHVNYAPGMRARNVEHEY